MGFSVGGFVRGAVRKVRGAAEKVRGFISPDQTRTPETWQPGDPAPPGYRVIAAGTRAEKIEPIPLTDAGGLRAVIDREVRGAGADTLRKVGGDLARNVANVARRVGDAAATGLAEPILQSEAAQRERKRIVLAFAALGTIALLTLFLTLKKRGGK